jgi:hypothetical protein
MGFLNHTGSQKQELSLPRQQKKMGKMNMDGLVYRQHIFVSSRVGINARSRKNHYHNHVYVVSQECFA